APAAMWWRGEIGRVRLDQQPIERQLGGDCSKRIRILERKDAGERYVKPELDAEERELPAGREAMQDGGEGSPPRLLPEDRSDAVIGLASMDDERQLRAPRRLDVTQEPDPLRLAG